MGIFKPFKKNQKDETKAAETIVVSESKTVSTETTSDQIIEEKGEETMESTMTTETTAETTVEEATETINNVDIETTEITEEEVKAVDEEKKVYSSSMEIPTLNSQEEIIDEIKKLNRIHTTWRDYALMLVNSTAEPLRSIWREKITTSVTHWEFDKGSISERNIAGMEILTVLPSDLTMYLVDDYFEETSWKKLNRLNGSKRMNVFVGRYLQESASNEAKICLEYLVKNWDNNVWNGKTGKEIIMSTPLLKRMWDLAQKSGGKCVGDDEILTYMLEKPVNDNQYGMWMDVCEDIFANDIPSDKYKDYWKSDKIEGYPLAVEDDNNSGVYKYTSGAVAAGYAKSEGELVDEAKQKDDFLKFINIILREDVSWQACYKKICICILKNDISFKYAGFGATLRERLARENAMSAFSTKQEEQKKAKANAEALAAKIEKERKESERK